MAAKPPIFASENETNDYNFAICLKDRVFYQRENSMISLNLNAIDVMLSATK